MDSNCIEKSCYTCVLKHFKVPGDEFSSHVFRDPNFVVDHYKGMAFYSRFSKFVSISSHYLSLEKLFVQFLFVGNYTKIK